MILSRFYELALYQYYSRIYDSMLAVPGFTEPRTVSPLNRIDDVLTLTADPVEILPTELLKRPMHARAHNLSVASSG